MHTSFLRRTYALLPTLLLIATYSHGASLYRGPYLQMGTPQSMVVVWRTEGMSTPELRYGLAPETLDQVVSGSAITLRVSEDVGAENDVPRLYKEPAESAAKRNPKDHDPSTAPDTYQYEAHVKGLKPGNTYYYAVYDGDTRLAGGDAAHHFKTHPAADSAPDMRIWVLGDSGKGSKEQIMVFDAMNEFTAKSERPLDHFLHVGDMAYDDGTDWEFQKRFFEPYQSTLRNTVCWPAIGNHEGVTSRGISGYGPYFDAYVVPTAGEVGGAASGTEAYYSFDIAGVHFICLDSHDLDRKPDGAMAQWLRADLEQTSAQWLIAFWHHPPYSKGTHDSDAEHREIEMRESFMPILESAGVDLTLTGHSHIYERSMLMDGAYATPTVAEGVILDDGDGNPKGDGAYRKSAGLQPNEGSVSIVAGHGGTTNGRMGTSPVMRSISVEHGSVILDITADSLTGIMVDKYGATQDLFRIVKSGSVSPQPVKDPWQPAHDISLISRHHFNFAEDTPGGVPAYWEVATGNPTGMSVIADEGKSRHLNAVAKATPLIGVFRPNRTQKFQYESYLRFPGPSDESAGLVFGYVDPANYWQLVVDLSTSSLRISQVSEGKERLITEKEVSVVREKWIKIKMVLSNSGNAVSFDDTPTFQFDAGAELSDGHLGFIVSAENTAEFLSFKIREQVP